MTDEKKPKRYVTIVTKPEKMIIGDPDLSDEEREVVRGRETKLVCPMCRNGLISNDQFKLWQEFQEHLKTHHPKPDPDPEGAP